ncbi:MAG TPA: hypothetical protein VD763_01945 [Candidatus Saccharimonadales bacterium]|nr:hypothetical protein [Candidatus Saccharimonadales bacterium]
MAGFVPGRDRVTLEALSPEETRRRQAAEAAEHQAALDKEELVRLELARIGAAPPKPKRSLLDRLLRGG